MAAYYIMLPGGRFIENGGQIEMNNSEMRKDFNN